MSLFRRDSQQTAEKLVAKGKIEAAIKEYRKLLGKGGDDPTTLNRVGDLYVRLRKNDEAVSFYTKTAEKYASDGFYVKAIAVYKKIHRIEPSQIEVHRKLAELYQRQGLKNDARNHYSQLSDHYLRNENTTAAIDVCRKMVELEPDNPSHHLKLADLYREAGNLNEALRSYGAIASLMLSHSQIDHAFQVYERAIGVDPSDLAFAAEAVTSLKQAGDLDKAVALVDLIESRNSEAGALRSLVSEASVSDSPSEGSQPAASELGGVPENDMSTWEPPLDSAPELTLADSESTAPEAPAPAAENPPPSLVADPEPVDDLVPAESAPLEEGPPSAGRPVQDPVSGEWSFLPEPELEEPEFELDLDVDLDLDLDADLTIEDPADVEPEQQTPEVAEPAPLPPASGPVPADEAVSREAELLSEADVFLKYGLADKGLERLDEVLEVAPGNVEALRRLIPLLVERGDQDRVVALASTLQGRVDELSEPDAWNSIQTTMAGAGYRFEGGDIHAPAPAAAEPEPEPSMFADAPIPAPEKPVQPPADMLDPDADFGLDEDLAPAEPGLDLPQEAGLGSLDDEPLELDLDADLDLGDLLADDSSTGESASPEPEPASNEQEPALEVPREAPSVDEPEGEAAPDEFEELAAASENSSSEPVEESVALEIPDAEAMDPAPALAELETSTEWLDEAPEASDKLFEDEAEFFDLAAALEGEMGDESPSQADEAVELPSEGEQSLDEIVEGFKRGVSENISEEDSDTHYNLGIAYREMMLLDEAIGEFQISARDTRYLVDSCAMLGLCFRDKGLPDLAVKWYQRALGEADLPEEQRLGMLYDLGTAFEDLDDQVSALDAFQDIKDLDGEYRDVAARITALEG